MAITSVNYPAPVQINGFACRNCSEVDLAKKNIDPAHPASGPNNRDAAKDPTRQATDPTKIAAARKLADAAKSAFVGYAATGAGVTAPAVGTIVSLAA